MAVADDVAVRPLAAGTAQPAAGHTTTSQPNGSATNGQSPSVSAAPNGAQTSAQSGASVELERLRMMLLIRRFEERTYQEYTKPGQKIGGFCHLYSGQEAVAVGIASVFDKGRDFLINGYRDHGH